jgi:hypothetical protein
MRIGNTSFPLFRLNALLKDTRIIHEKFGRKEITKEHIAGILGQNLKGGGFTQKMADLRAYGLLNGGHGKYSLSEIGEHATFGTPKEKAEALSRAVKNVDLWRSIYEKFGTNPNPETFWLDLVDLTGAGRPESQSKAESVLKAYMEDIKHILPSKGPEEMLDSKKNESDIEPVEAKEMKKDSEITQLPSSMSAFSIPIAEAPYIGFPEYIKTPIIIKDETSFKAAKVFWDAIEAKFSKKASTSETDKINQTPPSES